MAILVSHMYIKKIFKRYLFQNPTSIYAKKPLFCQVSPYLRLVCKKVLMPATGRLLFIYVFEKLPGTRNAKHADRNSVNS